MEHSGNKRIKIHFINNIVERKSLIMVQKWNEGINSTSKDKDVDCRKEQEKSRIQDYTKHVWKTNSNAIPRYTDVVAPKSSEEIIEQLRKGLTALAECKKDRKANKTQLEKDQENWMYNPSRKNIEVTTYMMDYGDSTQQSNSWQLCVSKTISNLEIMIESHTFDGKDLGAAAKELSSLQEGLKSLQGFANLDSPIVSSQKPEADPSENPELEGHDESSSANLLPITEVISSITVEIVKKNEVLRDIREKSKKTIDDFYKRVMKGKSPTSNNAVDVIIQSGNIFASVSAIRNYWNASKSNPNHSSIPEMEALAYNGIINIADSFDGSHKTIKNWFIEFGINEQNKKAIIEGSK